MLGCALHQPDNYEASIRLVRSLGRTHGFEVCAFWQPAIIFGNKPLVSYERQLLGLSYSNAYPLQQLIPVYREAERRAHTDGEFAFLGDTFDQVENPLYLDWVHLNPAGNHLAARAVAKQLDKCRKE